MAIPETIFRGIVNISRRIAAIPEVIPDGNAIDKEPLVKEFSLSVGIPGLDRIYLELIN